MKHKILIIDDQTTQQEWLLDFLGKRFALTTAADAAQMRSALAQQRFDLAILDIDLNATYSGADLLPELAREKIALIVYTGKWDSALLRDCRIHQVKGYCDKGQSRYDLIDAIDIVLQGGTYLPLHLAQRALQRDRINRTPTEQFSAMLNTLSQGQCDILHVLCLEKEVDTHELAQALGYTEGTVKRYIVKLLHKFKQKSRRALIEAAMNAGFKAKLPQRVAQYRRNLAKQLTDSD